VIVGDPESEGAASFQAALARLYRPFMVVVPVAPSRQREIARLLPFVGAMNQREGRPTAYVCRDFACREPVTSADGLAGQV
jgi:hypothetical protein